MKKENLPPPLPSIFKLDAPEWKLTTFALAFSVGVGMKILLLQPPSP
jgi:hypothetical protein